MISWSLWIVLWCCFMAGAAWICDQVERLTGGDDGNAY